MTATAAIAPPNPNAPGSVPAPTPAALTEPQPPVASTRQNAVGKRPSPLIRPSGFLNVRIPKSTTINGVVWAPQVTYAFAGDRFTILSTNLPINIQPQPAGRPETYYQGMSGNFDNDFTFLQIRNLSTTTDLVAKLWVGFEDLQNFTTPILPVQALDLAPTIIAQTGVIQPVSVVDLWVRKCFFYAINGFNADGSGIVNPSGGPINLGKISNRLPDQLAPGQSFPYEVPVGQMFNLAQIYVSGTAGDGVYPVGT